MMGARTSKVVTDPVRSPITQSFHYSNDGAVVREVSTPHATTTWRLPRLAKDREAPASTTWFRRRFSHIPEIAPSSETLKMVDVFSGAGGFGAGFVQAALANGFATRIEAAIDIDRAALASHAKNLKTQRRIDRDAALCIDYALRTQGDRIRFAYLPEFLEPELAEIGACDVVIGGPPCQGHSNLNNHTRRADYRNGLYFVVPAMAVALNARIVIIENVTTVLKDRGGVVPRAISLLTHEGYGVSEVVLKAEEFGIPQLRRRHFLVGVKGVAAPDVDWLDALKVAPITASEAIDDLRKAPRDSEYDRPTELAAANADRARYLFENEIYDLPNERRPDCHRDGHTYPSVYGRMRPNEPAATITGGFLQPGQGRFIHPFEPRSLTPHEGARLQGFSDEFKFIAPAGRMPTRKEYAQMIGDAVPPPLGFAIAMLALAALPTS